MRRCAEKTGKRQSKDKLHSRIYTMSASKLQLLAWPRPRATRTDDLDGRSGASGGICGGETGEFGHEDEKPQIGTRGVDLIGFCPRVVV